MKIKKNKYIKKKKKLAWGLFGEGWNKTANESAGWCHSLVQRLFNLSHLRWHYPAGGMTR